MTKPTIYERSTMGFLARCTGIQHGDLFLGLAANGERNTIELSVQHDHGSSTLRFTPAMAEALAHELLASVEAITKEAQP